MTGQEIAQKNLILKAVVGSTVHGLHLPGTDDRDEMGICIEPMEKIVGLQNFEQYIHRDQPEGVPSQPGDLDLVVYSLRKYIRLAAAGNPTILILLFAPPIYSNEWGKELIANSHIFASRLAGQRFLGYLKAQKERMLGTRGQMRVTRTELIEKHGYDTKYAMHMVRLGYQGMEYLRTGKLTLPIPEPARTVCMNIRLGKIGFLKLLDHVEFLENEIKKLIEASPLPRVPDFKKIDQLLVNLYSDFWFMKKYNEKD